MCTSTVIATSIGGNQSIGDPSICGDARLGVRGDNVVPHRQSAPITIASESDCGSSYASPSNHSMMASQSCECRHLFGSASSSVSVCLALSLLSSPHSSSVSEVGSSGSHASSSSSDMEESSGQLTNWQTPSPVIQAASSEMCGT